ncbi:MAG: hypothetical protein JJT76_03220 [Clostridiaceae bacterium]|nr:hypothetical protein [Clostridiaceae bacterium]
MKKSLVLYGIMIMFFLVGCRQEAVEEEYVEGFKKITEIEGFRNLSGYRVDGGGFYFTGIKENKWYFYRLDLNTKELKEMHQKGEEYDVYIPIGAEEAVYIDLDGQLLYSIDDTEKKIAEEVKGHRRPNLLLSPNRDALLYTTGTVEDADLYLYNLQQEEYVLVKENISEDAFNTFGFTTQWSNEKNHFIFHNREVYDAEGNRYAVLDATMAKWAPNDVYIGFIRKPDNLREEEIIIGDWQTYIGYEFMLFNVENLQSEVIYETSKGLVDEIDSIQWSKDGQIVGVSLGEITRGSEGHLQHVDYEAVFLYDLEREEGREVGEVPYNYYEIPFNSYFYGSSLGRRDALEVIEIWGEDRKSYDDPVLLNSADMFMISHENEGYFINGDQLVSIVPQGDVELILKFPWKVSQLYFDEETRNFIVINKDNNLYLRKVN